MKINFTRKELDNIEIPSKGQIAYGDEQVKGLTIRVTHLGVKAFVVRKRLKGHKNASYVTLGYYPSMTITQARVQAQGTFSSINEGIDPNKITVDLISKQSITLQKVFDDYIRSRGTKIEESTVINYRSALKIYLGDWRKKPIGNITRNMVEQRHRDITYGMGKFKESPTRANTTMRVLRALFNYAHGQYEDSKGEPLFVHNPVQRISHNKSWNREKVRQGLVNNYDLKQWYEGIMSLPEHGKNTVKRNSSEVVRDLFIFIIFTGLRRNEALELKWEDIDFRNNSFIVEDTKNHETHALPLTKTLLEILDRRKEDSDNPYVFQGENPNTHLSPPQKRQMARARDLAGVYFNLHDLRRTFETTANKVVFSTYTLKKLINHKDPKDVTGRYVIIQLEDLREPMKLIEAELWSHIK
jgi:integrase